MDTKTEDTKSLPELLPCPEQWHIDLIKGFPFGDSDDPDDGLRRRFAAMEAGLLILRDTETDSEKYEYGDTMFELTELGQAAYDTRADQTQAQTIAKDEWLPIDEKTKDQGKILIFGNGRTCTAYWDNAWNEWKVTKEVIFRGATHWQPLPKPPIDAALAIIKGGGE